MSDSLSESTEGEGVASLPAGIDGATLALVGRALADTTGAFALAGDAAELAVLLDTGADPVVLGVVADGVVLWVHQDDLKTVRFFEENSYHYLKVLVGGVLTNPV